MAAPIMPQKMEADGRGYVTDVPYIRTFIPSVAPAVLDHVAVVRGFTPPSQESAFTYCDLGCGQGVTAAILAATHPQGTFHGVDFMVGHIEHARRFCDEAEIGNATFHHTDFRTAAEAGLPQFDYVVCHGVYAWVNAEVQSDIVRFVDMHLKPGGLAYISYNAMPGWATDLPFQYLVRALGQTLPGDSKQRITAGVEMIRGMTAAKVPALTQSFMAKHLESGATKLSPFYLAHEFMNGDWRPLFVTEVREAMARIGLLPVGSASLMSNFDSFVLGAKAREMLASIADENVRELVRDYFIDQRFRRDVFIRDGRKITRDEQRVRLLASSFSLAKPATEVEFTKPTPAGSLRFDNEAARGIVTALGDGPRRLAEIAAACGLDAQDVVANALTLCAAGIVVPVGEHPASVVKLNRAIFARRNESEPINVLALPCGTALHIAGPLWKALQDGEHGEAVGAADQGAAEESKEKQIDVAAWKAFLVAQGV